MRRSDQQWLNFFVLISLFGLGSCALWNSVQLQTGFPDGVNYNRVLAYDVSSVLSREGCAFIAYELDEVSAELLMRDPAAANASSLGTAGNAFEPYSSARLGAQAYASGAAGGCEKRDHELPSARDLLSEAGNLASSSANGEGLSIISPKRRLVLFLYFG